MNFADPQIARAYKTGWQSGFRRARYLESIRAGASDLAKQVLLNEFERATRTDKRRTKKPKSAMIGNAAWKALEKRA